MSAEILVAIITSGLSFFGVVLTVFYGNKQHAKQLKEQTDLTLYRIKQLEEKQDRHNSLIERVYKLEQHNSVIDEKIRVANNRIKNIEIDLK